MAPEESLKKLDRRTDAILSSFDQDFAGILSKSQVRTALALRSKLELDERGRVKPTAANLRVVKALPRIFQQALEAEGYKPLISGFTKSFDGGAPLIEDVISTISDHYELKPVTFTAEDREYFDQLKAESIVDLGDAITNVANIARRNTLFTMGGRPFTAVAATLAERLHIALGEASTLGATGISTFYRTIAARGFEKIESALKPRDLQLEYTYVGPQDKFTRPFCERLVGMARRGRTWTRAQIDAMNNGQLPDVFRTCGGWNCRHQWVVALEHR